MPEGKQELPSRSNARNGFVLFVIYLAIYSGFVLLHAFAPSFMQSVLPIGINVAVLYGLGLIVVALVLALFYAWLCREPLLPDKEQSR